MDENPRTSATPILNGSPITLTSALKALSTFRVDTNCKPSSTPPKRRLLSPTVVDFLEASQPENLWSRVGQVYIPMSR